MANSYYDDYLEAPTPTETFTTGRGTGDFWANLWQNGQNWVSSHPEKLLFGGLGAAASIWDSNQRNKQNKANTKLQNKYYQQQLARQQAADAVNAKYSDPLEVQLAMSQASPEEFANTGLAFRNNGLKFNTVRGVPLTRVVGARKGGDTESLRNQMDTTPQQNEEKYAQQEALKQKLFEVLEAQQRGQEYTLPPGLERLLQQEFNPPARRAKGGFLSGGTSGQSDKIPAMLSDGEFVMDADTVSALGDGNNAAGASALEQMRQNVRAHKRSAPVNKIPPKAKKPEQYLKKGKK